MSMKLKNVFIFMIIISCFSLFVCGDWEQTGYDEFNSRNQPLFDGYFTQVSDNISIDLTLDTNYISTIKPLSADFDGDGVEEIFLYDVSTGTIGVFNIDSSYNIILKDTYTIGTTVLYNPAISSFSISDGGKPFFIIRDADLIYIFKYESSQLNLLWNVTANLTTGESQTLCVGQGATLSPVCYWLNNNGNMEAVSIQESVQPTLSTSSNLINSAKVISGVTMTATDLDSNTVKSIVFNYDDPDGTGGIQHHMMRIDGLNYSIYDNIKFGNPCASNSPTDIIKTITTPSTFCYVGGYDGFTSCKGRSLIRCYNSSDGSEASSQEIYAVGGGVSTVSSYYYADLYKGDFDGDSSDEFMLIGSDDSQITHYRLINILTGTPSGNINTGVRLDNGITTNSILNENISIIKGNVIYSLNSSNDFNSYNLDETISPLSIVSDFNKNGFNDVIGMDSINGMEYYFDSVAPPLPVETEVIEFLPNLQFNGFYYFYGTSPTCTGTSLNFKINRCLSGSSSEDCSYYYDGTERQRVVANIDGELIYGDWTYSASDFTLSVSNLFALDGAYNIVLYVQTEDKPSDFSKNSGQIIINVNGNQQGINCNKPDNFLDSPKGNDDSTNKEEGIDDIFNILLGNNIKTKFIIGIGMVIGLMVFVAFEFSKRNREPHWLILLIVFILAVVLCTVLGLFPAWFIVLMLMVAVLIMVFIGVLKPKGQ